jgi:hypothetical protein
LTNINLCDNLLCKCFLQLFQNQHKGGLQMTPEQASKKQLEIKLACKSARRTILVFLGELVIDFLGKENDEKRSLIDGYLDNAKLTLGFRVRGERLGQGINELMKQWADYTHFDMRLLVNIFSVMKQDLDNNSDTLTVEILQFINEIFQKRFNVPLVSSDEDTVENDDFKPVSRVAEKRPQRAKAGIFPAVDEYGAPRIIKVKVPPKKKNIEVDEGSGSKEVKATIEPSKRLKAGIHQAVDENGDPKVIEENPSPFDDELSGPLPLGVIQIEVTELSEEVDDTDRDDEQEVFVADPPPLPFGEDGDKSFGILGASFAVLSVFVGSVLIVMVCLQIF